MDDKKQGMDRKFYAYDKVREEQEYVAGYKGRNLYQVLLFRAGLPGRELTLTGTRSGKWTKYFEDGSVRQEGNYKDGRKKAYGRHITVRVI